jgi:hypothetical protein
LVQAFLKKWWVESDFKAPNLLLSLWLKGSDLHDKIYLFPTSKFQIALNNNNSIITSKLMIDW